MPTFRLEVIAEASGLDLLQWRWSIWSCKLFFWSWGNITNREQYNKQYEKFHSSMFITMKAVNHLLRQQKLSCLTENTFMLRALFSISDVHFRMMKGMSSWLFLAACVKSIPKRWSLPWSFLWPHWMARVSRHFLWQANEHCTQIGTYCISVKKWIGMRV